MVEFHTVNNFISKELCDYLIGYYESNYDIVLQNPEEVPQADNFRYRVMWYRTIKSAETKTIMDWISDRTYEVLFEKFGVDVRRDSLQIVRWLEGEEMGLHADNAFWPSAKPNFTPHRTHSSILFLNDNYSGGNFYFEKYGEVKPESGKLLVFPADIDYAHGVTKVLKGKRYTIASWYTNDKKFFY